MLMKQQCISRCHDNVKLITKTAACFAKQYHILGIHYIVNSSTGQY